MYRIRRIREGLFSLSNLFGEPLAYTDSYEEAKELLQALKSTKGKP